MEVQETMIFCILIFSYAKKIKILWLIVNIQISLMEGKVIRDIWLTFFEFNFKTTQLERNRFTFHIAEIKCSKHQLI
jgi:hypothetical protein